MVLLARRRKKCIEIRGRNIWRGIVNSGKSMQEQNGTFAPIDRLRNALFSAAPKTEKPALLQGPVFIPRGY
jgi:hypothetical protein